MRLLHCYSAVFVVLYFKGTLAVNNTLGQACTSEDTCSEGLLCSNGYCKAMIGANCTALSRDQCVPTSAPCPAGEHSVCTCPSGASPTANKAGCLCADGRVTSEDDTKCVPQAGQACNDSSGCLKDATCEGPDDDKRCKCIDTMTPTANNERCVKKVGEPCNNGSDCLEGAECKGLQSKRCTCDVPYANNTKCPSGASAVMASLVLLLLAYVVTSRWM